MEPIGVQAALAAYKDANFKPRSTIFDEFSLKDRVAVVTGGKQGLGLEMAMAMAEAGAIVHCLDLPPNPTAEFDKTRNYVAKLGGVMHYASANVTNQNEIWDIVETIATKEGRMDIAIAAAGILHGTDCLDYKDTDFQRVRN
jgi:NAD(P)-dependent dehydrogenase (short-subunit alcohol dehydrogenase family)